ncbi:Dynamin [Penicillium occitanis (nom. inval.)]|nr:Dynamin [Penicillium occitanis (nom. inval.)]PCH08781.1 hypothetical protein PENOC_012990 [Penicillium occitanis (nom. inval.)]
MAQSSESEHNTIHDLIDERQIDLFDALDRLAKLKAAGQIRIDVPQLVVVGAQSSGKSSTLEALVRFQFPVHAGLCTRFPIRLILRRSEQKGIHVSVELKSQRTEQETAEVLQSIANINKTNTSSPEQVRNMMMAARSALGVKPVKPMEDPAGSHHPTPPAERAARSFTEDVLIIEQSGPNVPLLTLLDLPSIFLATSEEQDEVSRETVKGYIMSKRAVVMLVVSASEGFHNSNIISTLQGLRKEDARLEDRVIGVITKTDEVVSHEETAKLLRGEIKDLINPAHGWHVVRNQNSDERKKGQPLDDRDQNEINYFSNQPWRGLIMGGKGIASLRSTLKDVLWTHTMRELPGCIFDVKTKIEDIKFQLETANKSRATSLGRRRYLSNIAQKFERLTTEAVQGTYEDEPCTELHLVGFSCRNCRPFFPHLRDDRIESQVPKLRANVRALSKAFAITMRKYGKTQIIGDTDKSKNVTVDAQGGTDNLTDPSPGQQPGRSRPGDFISQKVLDKYYSHEEPQHISREDHLRGVTEDIEGNRAREPLGEASEALHWGLFHWQSKKWEKIATQHLFAVWSTIEEFMNLVLSEVCEDPYVLHRLREKIIIPNLEEVKKSSNRTLKDLLSCRSRGVTRFHDGYFHIMGARDFDESTLELTERLNGFPFAGLELNESARLGFVKLLNHTLSSLAASPVNSFSLNGFVTSLIVSTIQEKLSKCDSSKSDVRDKPSKTTTTTTTTTAAGTISTKTAKTQKDTTPMFSIMHGSKDGPERATDHVGAHYRLPYLTRLHVYMMSFVGYVNSLFIEIGILRKLANDIFSQSKVIDADEEVIDYIAKERSVDAQRRNENESNLQALTDILNVLQNTQIEQ